jgi:hypothetical protein
MEVGKGPNWGCSAKEKKIKNQRLQLSIMQKGHKSQLHPQDRWSGRGG